MMNSRSTYSVFAWFLWIAASLAIAGPNELPKADNLYADAQQMGWKIEYNKFKLQKFSDNISDCGRWCAKIGRAHV